MLVDTTFIYFLRDPENPMRGYVGKTDNPLTRLPKHISECRTKKHYRANWIKSLAARGLKPALEIIDEVPFEHWSQLEVAYIEFFLEQGYELTNATPGGECGPSTLGIKQSQETCEKRRAALLGGKHSPETIAKRSASLRGKISPKKGKPRPEIIESLKARRGEKRSPQACANYRIKKAGASSKFYGVCWRPEIKKWRARLSAFGKQIGLGFFSDEIEAAQAYDVAAKIHHGKYAKLNFPD